MNIELIKQELKKGGLGSPSTASFFCKFKEEDRTYEDVKTRISTLIDYEIKSVSENNQFKKIVAEVIKEKATAKGKQVNDRFMNDARFKTNGKRSGEIRPQATRYKQYNKVDQALLKPFFYGVDENDEISYYLKDSQDKNVYKRITRASSAIVNIDMLKTLCMMLKSKDGRSFFRQFSEFWTKMHETTTTELMKMLNTYDKAVNSNTGDSVYDIQKAITTLLDRKLPLHALNNMITVVPLVETNQEGQIWHTDVEITKRGTGGESVGVFEYLNSALPLILGMENKRIEMPKTYSSVAGVNCLNYFDLDTYIMEAEDVETPAWNEYSLRYTADEWEVFKAFNYGIFDSTSGSRQMLYLYDNGFSGKSVYQSAIMEVLGSRLVQGIQKDSMNNQFGMAKIWDKRLTMVGDNKNKNIVRSEKIHMLLGGDLSDIEMKGKNSFSYQIETKMIVNGNILPDIDPHATHERTRLIVLKPKHKESVLKLICQLDENGNAKRDKHGEPVFIGDKGFKGKLIAEFQSFLLQCKKSYETLAPSGGNIILPDSVNDDLYDLGSEEMQCYDDFCNKYFEFKKDATVEKTEVSHIWQRRAEDFNLSKSSREYSNFITYIRNRHHVEEKRIKTGDTRTRVMTNMSLKSSSVKTSGVRNAIV